MNKDFEKRSKMAIEVLSILIIADKNIVFIGGSAIQVILQKPKRISIDLDISYFGAIEKLIEALENANYKVIKRQSKNSNFLLFNVSKENLLVKLDISKLQINNSEKKQIKSLEVLFPPNYYFVVSKLSALAFGTIGRIGEEQSRIIKDIFDINCLLNENVSLENANSCWLQTVNEQNKLRNTKHKEKECAMSVQEFLLKCIGLKTEKPIISVDHLGNFNEYLIEGTKRIAKFEFVIMTARTLLLLVCITRNLENEFYNLEKKVIEEASKKENLDSAEKSLLKKLAFSKNSLHELKVSAPKALIYLKYWHEKKRGDDPILSTTQGYANSKYS